ALWHRGGRGDLWHWLPARGHPRGLRDSGPPSPGSRQPAAAPSPPPPPCRHAVTCQSWLTRSPGAVLTTAPRRTRLRPRRACCSTPCGERAGPGIAWARKMLKERGAVKLAPLRRRSRGGVVGV